MKNKNYPIQRTGSQDNERYQINKVLGDVLDTLDRASDWDAAASWGDHRTANYASEEDAILSGVTVPTAITLSYARDTLSNGTDIARIRAQWTRVTNPNFVYDLEIRERDIDASNTVSSPLGTLYSVPIISNTEGGSIAAYESEFKLGKNYQFRIRIRQNRVISPWSDYFAIDTLRDPQAPGGEGGTSPGGSFNYNLTATAGQASVLLKWTAPTSANLAYYELQRTAPLGSTEAFVVAGGNTQFIDTGLEAGLVHSYRIRSFSYEGNATAYSNTASATPTELEFIAPTIPTGLTANANLITGNTGDQSTGEIEVSWDRIEDDQIIYDLEIYIVPVGGGANKLISSPTTMKAEYTFLGKVDDTFSIRVRARKATAVSGWTSEIQISIPQDNAGPGSLSGGSALPRYQGAFVSWNIPSAVNYGSTRVERSINNAVSWEIIGEVKRPIDFIFDAINGITVDPSTKAVTTRLYYRLTPITTAGQVGTSIQVGPVTPSNIPDSTISAGQIIANSITANEIAANTITASQIAAGTIDASRLNITNVNQAISAEGEYGAIINAAGPTGPSMRSNGSPLQVGDIWIDTNDGNKPYTWDGADWVAAYTSIDGGDIITGTVTANKIDVDNLIVKNLQTATTGNRVEITDPSQPGVYLFWAGDGTKDDTAYFWIKENGEVFINKQIFGINDGQIVSGSFSGTNPSTGQGTTNILTATSADIVVASSLKLDVNFQFVAVGGAIGTAQGDCTGSGNISGTIQLQRRVAPSGSWVSVGTASLSGGGQNSWFPSSEPGIAPGVCTVSNYTDILRVFTDTPTPGTYNYRVVFSSWFSPYTTAQISTNLFDVAFLTSA